MTLGPREVMRSEEIDGLTGIANPIPEESLDCGCGQMPCPKLTKYATRKMFVGLLAWIGFVQVAGQTYFWVTRSTLARRFQFEPDTMEWLSLSMDGLLPFLIALPIAYWGDRIHRAAWTGGLALIQSAGYLILIIPHFTHPSTRVIEETTNMTHSSLYAEDNPELCMNTGLARLSIIEDNMCFITLFVISVGLIASCMANVGFFALGISYLDDNTRKRSVAVPIGVVIGGRLIGSVFGHLLGWGCLRIDAENLLQKVETYREQIGAWWLGWIILAILLAIPGVPMSWLPRRLPSEVVEEAAASIIEQVGRTSPLSESTLSEEPKKIGDSGYFSSLLRLITNEILLCKIFTSVFCIVAIVNYASNEDIILESDFYIPRPSGLFLGFGDPLTSRTITLLLRPIIIGFVIIASGFVIVKFRPRAKWLAGYNAIAIIIAATIFLSLAFLSCQKQPIAEMNKKGAISLLKLCNRYCRCSRDANFQPICDSTGSFNYYSPCHAGCTGTDDSGPVRKYTGCSCIKDLTGLLDTSATEGPCGTTTCQIGWIVFEVSTLTAYALLASCVVPSFIVALRATFVQDKALAIGLFLAVASIFAHVLGKLVYWTIADRTCIHRAASCHLHDPETLGAYLSYLTALLLLIAAILEGVSLIFVRNLKIYRETDSERYSSLPRADPGLSLVVRDQAGHSQDQDNNDDDDGESEEGYDGQGQAQDQSQAELEPSTSQKMPEPVEPDSNKDLIRPNGPLRYGPLGPGNPRITMDDLKDVKLKHISDDEDSEDDDLPRKAPLSLTAISYKRLDIEDSDETSESSFEGRRRRSVLRKSVGEIARTFEGQEPQALNTLAGFSRTDDIEFTKWRRTGDFNEVGIPVVNYALVPGNSRSMANILGSRGLDEMTRLKIEGQSLRAAKSGTFLGDRAFSPVEPASSGFGSCSSDLNRTVTETPTQASESEGSVRSGRTRRKPYQSTAL